MLFQLSMYEIEIEVVLSNFQIKIAKNSVGSMGKKKANFLFKTIEAGCIEISAQLKGCNLLSRERKHVFSVTAVMVPCQV